MSNYPSALDDSTSLPPSTDNVTAVKASVVNGLRSSILAIESELGTDPSREFGSVRDRLDDLASRGSGGGAELSDALPKPIGSTTPGVSLLASRDDHVHTDESVVTGTAITDGGLLVEDVVSGTGGVCRVKITGHPFLGGERVACYGVLGATGAHTKTTVTVFDADNIELDGTTFGGSYTTGGIVFRSSIILLIPCPDNANTSFDIALSARSTGGFFIGKLRVGIVIASGVLAAGSANRITDVDDNLGLLYTRIINLSNDGSGSIKVETSTPHYSDESGVEVVDDLTITGANGFWANTVYDSMHIILTGSTYISAGVQCRAYRLRDVLDFTWSAGILTVYVIGAANSIPLNWKARAESIL